MLTPKELEEMETVWECTSMFCEWVSEPGEFVQVSEDGTRFCPICRSDVKRFPLHEGGERGQS